MSPVDKDNNVEEAFAAILQRELTRIEKWEPVAAKGTDTEGVHQMRVGLRRMRSALALFKPVIPGRVTKSLVREMRWAATELDLARDLDVYIAENFSVKKLSGGKQALLEIAMKRRAIAYRQATGLIESERYRNLQTYLRHWLTSRLWRETLSTQAIAILESEVTPFAARLLQRHRRRVLKNGKNITKLSDEALHQLRIECKKLRYATEFFSPLYGKSMSTFTRHLKILQDVLGVLHDCAVTKALQEVLLRGVPDPDIRLAAEKIERRRIKEAKALKKELHQRWRSFTHIKRPWRDSL